ncbi:hypothetical protein K458DRAFT_409015 [Lentithecium fluviatile CBS 122367]|uniref:RING-type domain-containing protein n=1 Tax=Lentithecium fluviatile CBS 122367 TaxID=1168545 RepID=A0A6G1IJ60_9PLEO|nr:hypothetical protein K458DRAFT_409015 [Lentithecium fluviatile CBS 122367]
MATDLPSLESFLTHGIEPYPPGNLSASTCPICQLSYATPITPLFLRDDFCPTPIRTKTCNHVFGKSCLETWLRRHRPICPLCRVQLISERPEHRAADQWYPTFPNNTNIPTVANITNISREAPRNFEIRTLPSLIHEIQSEIEWTATCPGWHTPESFCRKRNELWSVYHELMRGQGASLGGQVALGERASVVWDSMGRLQRMATEVRPELERLDGLGIGLGLGLL